MGTIIAYRTRQAAWIVLGPISSAILCGAMFDFAKPWEILLVSDLRPFITMLGQRVMIALGIDDPKVVPLALFNGVAAAMVAGFVGWGTKTGGFIGLKGNTASSTPKSTPGGSSSAWSRSSWSRASRR